MSILGNIGYFYMVVLILILIGGFGMAGIGFYNFLFNGVNKPDHKIIKKNGGYVMQNNGWLKLAVFSFIGIILAFGALSLLVPNTMNQNSMAGSMQSTNGMNMTGSTNGMNMMGATNGSNMNVSPMGATQMQGTTAGMQSNDLSAIIYSLNQMQLQINQIQQQLMNNNNATTQSMPQGSMNSMPQGNMGGMGMMPMNNMSGSGSSMPASGSSIPASGSSMPASGSSSGGSMGMM